MSKFRKRPVVIDAVKWDGKNKDEIQGFIRDPLIWGFDRNDDLYIETLEGRHFATVGDYIIKGVKGEFYPCKSDIFELTYEVA